MSESCESVRWNACVHRLDLGLYSDPKEFLEMELEPMLTPREKSPLPEKFSSEKDRTHEAASSRTTSPTHFQRAIPALIKTILYSAWEQQGAEKFFSVISLHR